MHFTRLAERKAGIVFKIACTSGKSLRLYFSVSKEDPSQEQSKSVLQEGTRLFKFILYDSAHRIGVYYKQATCLLFKANYNKRTDCRQTNFHSQFQEMPTSRCRCLFLTSLIHVSLSSFPRFLCISWNINHIENIQSDLSCSRDLLHNKLKLSSLILVQTPLPLQKQDVPVARFQVLTAVSTKMAVL